MKDDSAKEDFEEADDLGDIDSIDDSLDNEETTPEPSGKTKNLDLILDIPLTVTVELGRSKMLINDLLQLGQGSVIDLRELAGGPLEVLVNQKRVARGEVVIVKEKFGVRLTGIVSPVERVQSLA